jgi:plastocyanin
MRTILIALMVALVSMGAMACGGGKKQQAPEDTPPPKEEPATPKTVEMVLFQYRFNPNSLNIEKGTTVVFKNKDQEKHNVSIPPLDIDKTLEPGDSFSHTFNTTGEFAVSNRFASGPMKATITVK